MRQHAHRGEVVQLGDAVPGVELQRAYVELVERVLSRVPVDDAARAVDVRASFLRTRNADGEERNAKALKCGIAVAPGPERTRRLRWRRGLLAREPLRGLARVVRQPGPTARRDRIDLRSPSSRSVQVRVRDAVTIEIGPEPIDVPAGSCIAAEGVPGPPGEPNAALQFGGMAMEHARHIEDRRDGAARVG